MRLSDLLTGILIVLCAIFFISLISQSKAQASVVSRPMTLDQQEPLELLPTVSEPESEPEPVVRPRVESRAVPMHVRRVWALVRGYTPWDDFDRDSPYRDGKTSIGKDTNLFPGQWGIAANPRVFGYGTRIRVPGYKPSTHFSEDAFWPVDDTGAITRRAYDRGITVDGVRCPPGTILIEVRFIHQRSARDWGNRWMWIEVIDK